MSGGGSKSIFHFLCYSLLMILCILFGYLFIFSFCCKYCIHKHCIKANLWYFLIEIYLLSTCVVFWWNIFHATAIIEMYIYNSTQLPFLSLSPVDVHNDMDRYIYLMSVSPIQIIILKIIYSLQQKKEKNTKHTTRKNKRKK